MFRDKRHAGDWLAGIIDGEGNISSRPVKGKNGAVREVRITNTDPELLSGVREALLLLGVEYTVYDRSERERLGTKPIFDIVVSRKRNLEHLASQIALVSYKSGQLVAMLGSYTRPGVPLEEDLRAWVEDGQTDVQIAARFSVTKGAVWAWRKKFGIERCLTPAVPAE